MPVIHPPGNSLSPNRPKLRIGRFRRPAWLLGLLLGCIPPAGHAVELTDIDNRHWLKLTAPGMLIISDASEGQLRKWAAEIELFRRGLELTLPVVSAGPENPATIFLFRSEGALKPFLPLVDGKPGRAAAFFNSILGHNLGAVSLGGSRFDSRERIYHEITHWHLQKAGGAVPLWLQEGLAQAYQSFTITGDKIRLGHDREGLFQHVRIAGTPPLGPLLRTAELDYSRAGFQHGRTDLFYAQSWALTHMLVFGTLKGTESVPRYLEALRRGLAPEAAFSAGFGLSVEQARERLDTYVRTPRWWMQEVPISRTGLPAHTVTPISAPELDASAALLLLAGGHKVPAQQLVSRRLRQNPDDPALWELQAALLLDPEHIPGDSAIGPLVRAYRLGSRNPFVSCLLGYAAIDGGLPAEVGRSAIGLFHEALQIRPGLLVAHEGIACLALAQGQPSPELRADVLAGLSLVPAAPLLNVAAAHLDVIDLKGKEARARLTRLLAEHPDLSMNLRRKIDELMAATQSESR